MPIKTKKELERQVSMLNDALEAALSASPITDNNFFPQGMSGSYTDRGTWDRKKIFSEALRAWRVNPIARRIVRLTTSFIIGKELKIKTKNEKLQIWLDEWAKKNQLKRNLKRWKDEDTRTGNLFILFNVLENKFSILRAIPAETIDEIITAPNDIEQEIKYTYQDGDGIERYWPAQSDEIEESLFVKHYASNQPVGSPWGEGDLSPLLVWIGRYSSWLEDRVRLNKFRTAFMYVVSGSYKSEGERSAREKAINANPPKSGSVLVINRDNGEDYGILSANLDSFDASVDGVTVKKMIMSGIGFPMHYFAEPESATSTTAEAAGTPTFRTLEENQADFFDVIIDLSKTAAEIAGFTVKDGDIWVEGSDITERDNATLALALGRSYPHLADMLDRNAIDDKEFLKQVYKMFAQIWTNEKTPKIKRKPLTKQEELPTPEDTGTDDTDPKENEDA
jgi:hypothetical protein